MSLQCRKAVVCYAVLPEAFMGFNVSFPEGWTAPRELAGALPRKTRMAKGGVLVVVIVALLVLGNSVWLVFDFREAAQEMARTAALCRGSSRETTGEVTRVWSNVEGRPMMVRYAFTANGVALAGECRQLRHLVFRRGDTLLIRFLSSNPAINHPAAWEGPEPDWWVEPCVFWMVFIVFGIWYICVLRRDRQLLAEGVPTAGVVLRCPSWLPTAYGVRRVKYQFRMPDGRVAEGSSYLHRPKIGSTVCVLYLPQNPRRNKVYSGLSYRVAQ